MFSLVLGTVLAQLRRRRAWTQARVAASVGVSQSALSRIESGRQQPDAILYRTLAAAFGMSVGDLDRQVDDGIRATRRAAEAVADDGRSPDELFSDAGPFALTGLIGFAVATVVDRNNTQVQHSRRGNV